MTYLKIMNRAVSALAADITSTATSLTVTTDEGAKFPASGDFHITIEDEILKCTARTTDTLTVVRAQEGTTAAAHIAGKSVELRITAGVLDSRTTWTLDKLLKGAGAGADPTEIDVPAGATTVRKTADETVNNSATLQNDDHLFFAVAANEIWAIQLIFAYYISESGSGIKFGWAVPTGATMMWASQIIGETTTLNTEANTTGLSPSSSITCLVRVFGVVVAAATAGNVNLQWAQSTAGVRDTTVKANSYLIGHKLA